MSEVINASSRRGKLRRELLTTTSLLVLLGFIAGAPRANASDDDDHPIVWINLGGQLERDDRAADLPIPAFFDLVQSPLHSPTAVDKAPLYSYGAEGSISFQPEESDWVLQASFRIGRSSSKKVVHDQTATVLHKYEPPVVHYTHYTPQVVKVSDAQPTHSESHAVIDFQVGKDMGLGLFNANGSSVLAAGLRFAQFSSAATSTVKAKPDLQFYAAKSLPPSWYVALAHYHVYDFAANTRNNFRAIGPSIAWNASQPLVGGNTSEIAFDWGLNAAVLFGRQKSIVHHQTKAGYVHMKYYPNKYKQIYHNTADHARDRAAIVPNLGGFAGLSFIYSNAKISFGYRGDFFFGALDTGVDSAERTTVGFYGPFASVSVGLP